MGHLRRIYFPGLKTGENLLSGTEFHHARNVLRVRKSNKIEVFDGAGQQAEAEIRSISKSQIVLQIERLTQTPPNLPEITLASAIPKYSHQESLVRMCTEIGVSEFQPVIFHRSSVREKFNIEKWKRWTIEACKQCGENYLPQVTTPMKFADLIPTISTYKIAFFGDAHSERMNASFCGKTKILVIVGPEGGFTDEEKSALRGNSAESICIGKNVLRIETAGVSICASLTREFSK